MEIDRPTEWALPGVLAEIARLTSVEVAIAFARKWGGRELYIPERPRPDHALAQTLGRSAALIFCERYKRENLRIPSARSYPRWYDARRMKRSGKSASYIASKLGINIRRVIQLTHGVAADVAPVRPTDNPHPSRCENCGRPFHPRRMTDDHRQFDLFD
jgi:hypothetical protein